MTTAIEYLGNKHKTLINNYCTPDGKYAESSNLIAIDMANLLLNEGKERPQIFTIKRWPIFENGLRRRKALEPILFSGRVKFRTHQFCICDGIVYDPLLKGPTSIKKYPIEVFGKGNFIIEKVFSTKRIKELF
jgi:hypothetical protein